MMFVETKHASSFPRQKTQNQDMPQIPLRRNQTRFTNIHKFHSEETKPIPETHPSDQFLN